MLTIDILTLFPDGIYGLLGQSIIGNGIKKGYLDIKCHQIRDYTLSKQARVDDTPYGGGYGMLLQADPLFNAHAAVLKMRGLPHIHTILTTPQGQIFNQTAAKLLALADNLIIVCGHYEGVDQRFIDECVDEELSIGDFVLTGGEIAALAIADAVGRLIPGVLADESCFTDDSLWDGLLEYPQYTKPEVWHGRHVPQVLTSGNHADIAKWRREQSLIKTAQRRPDLFEKLNLPPKEAERIRKKAGL